MSTDQPAQSEQEVSARREVVKLCRAMLSGELSYFEGALQIAPLRFNVGVNEDDLDFRPFVIINSDSDHLLPQDVRHRWLPEALKRLEPEFEKTEVWGRSFAAVACENLMRRFARPQDRSTT